MVLVYQIKCACFGLRVIPDLQGTSTNHEVGFLNGKLRAAMGLESLDQGLAVTFWIKISLGSLGLVRTLPVFRSRFSSNFLRSCTRPSSPEPSQLGSSKWTSVRLKKNSSAGDNVLLGHRQFHHHRRKPATQELAAAAESLLSGPLCHTWLLALGLDIYSIVLWHTATSTRGHVSERERER